MNDDAMVFAMANPNPEVVPEEAAPYVRIMATGRSDYPNQINNVLAFPGIFRGALDVRASAITTGMEVAAGHAIAAVVSDEELAADYIVPSVFNRDVVTSVAAAVAAAADEDGVSRRAREPLEEGAVIVNLGAFLALSALLIIAPGLDTALITRNALLHGRRAALATALGVNTGMLAWTAATAAGLAALIEASALAFTIVKLAGAAYLVAVIFLLP